MTRAERKIIADIIAAYPHIYDWQDEIEKEQETVIKDLCMPAKTAVARLMDLDRRRIDLCNLKVLYGIIERGLGCGFGTLCECVRTGSDSGLFDRAREQTERVGYDLERVKNEFTYLFKRLPKKRIKAVRSSRRGLEPIRFWGR